MLNLGHGQVIASLYENGMQILIHAQFHGVEKLPLKLEHPQKTMDEITYPYKL